MSLDALAGKAVKTCAIYPQMFTIRGSKERKSAGQTANQESPGKWPICVYVHVREG